MLLLKRFSLVTFLALNPLHADMLGGELLVGVFNHSASGTASYTSALGHIGSPANVGETLGFSETQDLFFKAYFEHPLPLLPNLKLGHTTLEHSGASTVVDFTWGELIDFTGRINNNLSLDISDATLYYEVLDNWVELDGGLTLRYISGDISVNSEFTSFSTYLPLLYTKARFNVLATDLSFELEANAMSYSDITAYDYALSVRYTLTMGLGLEAGYKSFHLESDSLATGLNTDLDFSGPYAAAVWDF